MFSLVSTYNMIVVQDCGDFDIALSLYRSLYVVIVPKVTSSQGIRNGKDRNSDLSPSLAQRATNPQLSRETALNGTGVSSFEFTPRPPIAPPQLINAFCVTFKIALHTNRRD